VGALLLIMGWSPFLAAPLGLASWIVFMLFLQTLARYLEEHGAAADAGALLVQGIGILIGMPLLQVLVSLLTVFHRGFFVLTVVLFFVWFFLLLRFVFALLQVLSNLRKALQPGDET
jgi:hypothetical protein